MARVRRLAAAGRLITQGQEDTQQAIESISNAIAGLFELHSAQDNKQDQE